MRKLENDFTSLASSISISHKGPEAKERFNTQIRKPFLQLSLIISMSDYNYLTQELFRSLKSFETS